MLNSGEALDKKMPIAYGEDRAMGSEVFASEIIPEGRKDFSSLIAQLALDGFQLIRAADRSIYIVNAGTTRHFNSAVEAVRAVAWGALQ